MRDVVLETYQDIPENVQLEVINLIRRLEQSVNFEIGRQIIIKPNLTSAPRSYESGTTTSVCIVEGILAWISSKNPGAQIAIVESDAAWTAREAFHSLGFVELVRQFPNVKLISLSDDELIKLADQRLAKLGPIWYPIRLLLNCDFFITISPLRRHIQERMVGTWENQFRTIPNQSTRFRLLPFLSEVLFDLNILLSPDLALLEGLVGLEGPGPVQGNPRKLGFLACGIDPLKIDLISSRLIGERPESVPHLRYATKKLHRRLDDLEEYSRLSTSFDFAPSLSHEFWRSGVRLRRISTYMDNIGQLFELIGFATSAIDIRNVLGGRLASVKDIIGLVREWVFKIGESDLLWDRRLAINKHVQEQMLS